MVTRQRFPLLRIPIRSLIWERARLACLPWGCTLAIARPVALMLLYLTRSWRFGLRV
jgi:hypothetical protein